MERTTPSVAICQSHTCPVGWIGTYRIFLPCHIASTQPCRSSCFQDDSTLSEAREKEELVIPTCQSFRTRSLGISGLGAAVRQGTDALHLIPRQLSDLKRRGCRPARFQPHIALAASLSYCLGSLPLQRCPRLHISASHCVGSIRTELIITLQ